MPVRSRCSIPRSRRTAVASPSRAARTWELVEVQVPTVECRRCPRLAACPGGRTGLLPARTTVLDGEDRPTIRDMSAPEDQRASRGSRRNADSGAPQGLRWAPDGNALSFRASCRVAAQAHARERVGRPRLLPVDEAARRFGRGVWSPDGEWLAYQRRVGSEAQIGQDETRFPDAGPRCSRSGRLEDAGRDSRRPSPGRPTAVGS